MTLHDNIQTALDDLQVLMADINQLTYQQYLIVESVKDMVTELDEQAAPAPEAFLVGVNSTSNHVGQFPITRRFFGFGALPSPTSFSGPERQLVSLKPPSPQETAAYVQATIDAWVASGRAIENLRLCVWHEPEDNGSAAWWGEHQQALASKAAQYDFIPVAVFTASISDPFYAQIPPGFEVWLDPYIWDGTDTDLFDTSSWTGSRLVPTIDRLQAGGFAVGIAEFGSEVKDPGQAGWLTRQVQWFVDRGLLGAIYFDRVHTNSGVTRNWLLTPDGLAALLAFA